MSGPVVSEKAGKAVLRLTDIAGSLQQDWVKLALQLDVTGDEERKIKAEITSFHDQALAMLQLWVRKNKEATNDKLQKALENIGREDIIVNCMHNMKPVIDNVERVAANLHLHLAGSEVFAVEPGTTIESVELVDVLCDNQDSIDESAVHDGICRKLKTELPEQVVIVGHDSSMIDTDTVLQWDVDTKDNIVQLITPDDIPCINAETAAMEAADNSQEPIDELQEDSSSRGSDHITEDHVTTQFLDKTPPTDDYQESGDDLINSNRSEVSSTVNKIESISRHEPQTLIQLYPCPDCNLSFYRKAHLVQHRQTHRTDRPFVCPQCDSIFKRERSLKSHMHMHTGEARFLCCRCGMKFTTNNKLKNHMQIHTTENDSTPVKRHGRTSGEKPVVCPLCDKRFAQKDYLKTHIRGHTGDQPFACSQCDKRFIRQRDLDIHRRIHTGERPYSCPYCDKSFRQIGDLNVHVRGHTGERQRYSCPQCDTQFNFKNSLKRHIRVHAGSEPFVCLYCDKKFNQNHDLKIHVRIHTGERPYTCAICDASFASRNGLIRHERTHTGIKPFPCDKCSSGFTTKKGLLRHIRTHNGN